MTKFRRFIIAALIGTFLFATGSVYFVVRDQSDSIYISVQDVPPEPVAIVFGAGIGTPVLSDRVATAVKLYNSGKVKKILMTGDNGHANYDEPNAMKALAIVAGVPARDIVCDYAGFRTYDSLYRARDIFDVHQAILVTQGFHLPRAIFIAKSLGMSVIGIDASLHSYGGEETLYELREIVASECAWLDVSMHKRPRFLGKKESVFIEMPISDSRAK